MKTLAHLYADRIYRDAVHPSLVNAALDNFARFVQQIASSFPTISRIELVSLTLQSLSGKATDADTSLHRERVDQAISVIRGLSNAVWNEVQSGPGRIRQSGHIEDGFMDHDVSGAGMAQSG